MVSLELFFVVLAADFVSGLVHWIEDTFWTEATPLVGAWIVAPNVLHHRNGRAFLAKTWLESSWELVLASLVLVAVAAGFGVLTWHVWLFALLSANANQLHKWSHRTDRELSPLLRALRRLHVLQSFEHHARHHRGAKDVHYCVLTELVNPVLDGTRFWRALERVFARSRSGRWRPGRASGAGSGSRPE